ncbi:MAG: signal recognition particle-docking protein FtsY [Pseudomonadota bacterium]|nr:signal recognition particle-docking protein FtsY [Pseudomonadota bacterium]
MLRFKKRKPGGGSPDPDEAAPGKDASTQSTPDAEGVAPTPTADSAATGDEKPAGWMGRIRAGLGRTRNQLVGGLGDLVRGRKAIDDDLFEALEEQLLLADCGIEATQQIISGLTERVSRKQLQDVGALRAALREELQTLLEPVSAPLNVEGASTPFVVLVVGVNGVGKTTTIGKLAHRFQRQGKKVMLAAGDTFRAAAVEQLKVWGDRNQVPVVAQHTGADSASVLFDAVQAAKARGFDVLIADTAGRLHNKAHLMDELGKVVRVIKKVCPEAPHEVLLVLDAGTGQNALAQARTFHEVVDVSGIALTKLDGTAKGGVVFAIAKQLQLPIRFIGVGEGIEDLRPFDAEEFIGALFEADGP